MQRTGIARAALVALGLMAAATGGLAQADASAGSAAYWSLPDAAGQVVEVAIILDVSGSMGPLIEAAQRNLWGIVEELSLLEPPPILRVALLTYPRGKRPEDGWVTIEADLTEDLDFVSERLFALETVNGFEYVSRALEQAIQDLSWSEPGKSMRLVFIAGNESAGQDAELDYREVAARARQEGILVSAIFCGTADHKDATSWTELAAAAEGQFAAIDHRASDTVVPTPFDQELAAVSQEMNETFVPVGEEGRRQEKRMLEQDRNARKLSLAAAASRAEAKAGQRYGADWDLVGAIAAGAVDLDQIPEAALPRELRRMAPEERQRHLEDLAWRREELRRRIAELGAERRQHLAAERQARGADDSRSFGAVVLRTLREGLAEAGLEATGN